jgi:hypothetical protein
MSWAQGYLACMCSCLACMWVRLDQQGQWCATHSVLGEDGWPCKGSSLQLGDLASRSSLRDSGVCLVRTAGHHGKGSSMPCNSVEHVTDHGLRSGGTLNTWRSGDDGRLVSERSQVRF